jgi:hypothetical protein
MENTAFEKCNIAIREKLPHLQELSFGCEIKTLDWRYKWQYCWTSFIYCKLFNTFKESKNGTIMATIDELEILWHPIQINDWLGLLGRWYAVDGRWYILYLLTHEWDYQRTPDVEQKAIKIDLSKPFDSQSEPFYRFLLENIT